MHIHGSRDIETEASGCEFTASRSGKGGIMGLGNN